jgi:hypothetical protein
MFVKAHFLKIVLVLLVLIILAGLGGLLQKQAKPTAVSQSQVINFLYQKGVLQKDFVLVHFSQVCNLVIAGEKYPVYDSREDENNVSEPRGVNQIIVMSPDFEVRQAIKYVDARPLECQNNRLYTWGDITVDDAHVGNTLEFLDGARTVVTSETDILKLPNYQGQ